MGETTCTISTSARPLESPRRRAGLGKNHNNNNNNNGEIVLSKRIGSTLPADLIQSAKVDPRSRSYQDQLRKVRRCWRETHSRCATPTDPAQKWGFSRPPPRSRAERAQGRRVFTRDLALNFGPLILAAPIPPFGASLLSRFPRTERLGQSRRSFFAVLRLGSAAPSPSPRKFPPHPSNPSLLFSSCFCLAF